MSAIAPIVSARVAANRRNTARSTGAKTPAGKARPRANALKHGLIGAGVALSTEDAAILSIRRERCKRHFQAADEQRIRHAVARLDSTRAEHADRLMDAIEADPRTHRRARLVSPEGGDRLAAPELAPFESDRPTELARRCEQPTARERSRTLRDIQLAEPLAAPIAAPIAEAEAATVAAAANPDPNPKPSNEIGPMASFGETLPGAPSPRPIGPRPARTSTRRWAMSSPPRSFRPLPVSEADATRDRPRGWSPIRRTGGGRRTRRGGGRRVRTFAGRRGWRSGRRR